MTHRNRITPRLALSAKFARFAAVCLLTAGSLSPMLPSALAQSDVDKQFGADKYDSLIDWPMLKAPSLPDYKSVIVFHPDLVPLFSAALSRPDVETRRHAVDAIANAYQRGCKEMNSLVPRMRKKLAAPDTHVVERLSIISALSSMDDSDAAGEFLRLNKTGDAELILGTDPALARWKPAGCEDIWLERLESPKTPRAIRASAIESAGAVRSAHAAAALTAIALDRTGDAAFRAAAARAAGLIREAGLESSVSGLLQATNPPVIDRLVAALLLHKHRGPDAKSLLMSLAVDLEPAVATIAAGRLNELDLLFLTPISAKLATNGDVGVRRLAAESLVAQKTPLAVATLCPLLNDPVPELRNYVRNEMLRLDNVHGLREPVRSGVTRILAGEDWRGLEAASLILGRLDHKPAVDRLMAIKSHPRDEVRIAAVTAIRWLAVPETLPLLLKYLEEQTVDAPDLVKRSAGSAPAATEALDKLRRIVKSDAEFAQIMQFFAAANYKTSESLLRKFIPKKSMPFNSARAAAIWTLGQFHIDKVDEELASQFLARYNDTRDIMNPESGEVRHMALISMGFMRYTRAVGAINGYLKEDNTSSIAAAGRWALKRINGTDLPEPPPAEDLQTGFFLEPRRAIPANPPAK